MIKEWLKEHYEPTLKPIYGSPGEENVDGWRHSESALQAAKMRAAKSKVADFTNPSYAIGYDVEHNEGGDVGIIIDKTGRWVFFYSQFSD